MYHCQNPCRIMNVIYLKYKENICTADPRSNREYFYWKYYYTHVINFSYSVTNRDCKINLAATVQVST